MPPGLLLVAVGEPVDAELVPVAEQPEELAGVGAPRDQHDLGDPGLDQRLDRPLDHRPVVDRQQVLVGDAGEREQPRAGPPGQKDALHRRQPSTGPRWSPSPVEGEHAAGHPPGCISSTTSEGGRRVS